MHEGGSFAARQLEGYAGETPLAEEYVNKGY